MLSTNYVTFYKLYNCPMKKFLLLTILFLFFYQNSIYSQAINEWTIHMAYHDATKTAPAGNIIYVLSDGSLYSYNTEDSGIQTYDKTNYLNDVVIKDIEYNKTYKTLLIVYDNSNIDLLINNEETFNISDFMNKSMIDDKTLNNIYINNEYAYLSTNFGIVVLNLKKREITNSYNLGKKVYNTIQVDKTIYAATSEGMYIGKTTDNLLDKSNWKLINNKLLNNIIYYDKDVIGITNDGIYIYDIANNSFNPSWGGNYKYANIYDNQLIIGGTNNIVIYDNNINQKRIINTEYTNHLSYENNIYWGSNGENGLNGYKLNTDNNQLEKTIESVIPNSPRRNLDYYLTYTDRLLIAGGGIWEVRYRNPGTIMELKDDENWAYYEEGSNIISKTGLIYEDITKIVQDPKDPEHLFATSAGEGLYEFQEKKFVKLYNESNSILESVFSNDPNYIRLSGIKYDNDNNLWIMNSRVDKASIKIMKNDGNWIGLYYPNFIKNETIRDILFDQRGWAWINSARMNEYNSSGIFCLNTNNTLENTNDDQTVFYSSFTNQNNETLSPMYFYCIVEDLDGTIWIGTNEGPIVINNPSKIFENNSCTQIIVPRNDGTNLGDYLLEHESIKTICIDGNNRKWIGTENSGVYLLSADGLKTIHHFTTENSPLISNEINSIAINHKNGEVFIGTSKGLVSYKSDATTGMDSFDDNLVHAYPNPVPSYHDGLIAVIGLMRDSNVKIVDTSGKLVYAGKSIGGQFTWDGKDKSGRRVPSGVYMVLATNAEGKEGVATKIVMIK